MQVCSYKVIYHKVRSTELEMKSQHFPANFSPSSFDRQKIALLKSNYDNLITVIDNVVNDRFAGLLDRLDVNSSISLHPLPENLQSTSSLAQFVKETVGALVKNAHGNIEVIHLLLDCIGVCRLAFIDIVQANHLAAQMSNNLLSRHSQVQ